VGLLAANNSRWIRGFKNPCVGDYVQTLATKKYQNNH
jgi:hypothetical protein